jgi:hypothetical protein
MQHSPIQQGNMMMRNNPNMGPGPLGMQGNFNNMMNQGPNPMHNFSNVGPNQGKMPMGTGMGFGTHPMNMQQYPEQGAMMQKSQDKQQLVDLRNEIIRIDSRTKGNAPQSFNQGNVQSPLKSSAEESGEFYLLNMFN